MALSLGAQDEQSQSQQKQPPQPLSRSGSLSAEEFRESMVLGFQSLKEKQKQQQASHVAKLLSLQTSLRGSLTQSSSPLIGPPKPANLDIGSNTQAKPSQQPQLHHSNLKKRSLSRFDIPRLEGESGGASASGLLSQDLPARKKQKLELSGSLSSLEEHFTCPICEQEDLREIDMLPHVVQVHSEIMSRPVRHVRITFLSLSYSFSLSLSLARSAVNTNYLTSTGVSYMC